jgi:hypothetical protein
MALRGRAGYAPALHVRFGSQADIPTPFADVRFTPESGHQFV